MVNGEGGEKAMSEHSEEQGLRVHHLVNLGGLTRSPDSTASRPIFSWAR